VKGPDVTSRLRAYRHLSRLVAPRRYVAKILLLVFVATHVPLLALVAYLVLGSDARGGQGWGTLGVAVAGTLLGTALVLAGLWVLLAPVAGATAALTAYRVHGVRPTLPTDLTDQGGQLLAEVQHTLLELDAALVHLEDLATHDRVTGLLNRGAGEQRLEEALTHVRASGGRLALLAFDADGLKGVNDRWGHAAGDRSLRQLATMIAQHVGPAGWVARWGGDEFVAVLPEHEGNGTPEAILKRIGADLAADPLCLPSGARVRLGVSGGVAWAGEEDDTAALVARADAALYRAKRAGAAARGRVAVDAWHAQQPTIPADEVLHRDGGAVAPAPVEHGRVGVRIHSPV
jgi:diguanylate cyclase (GGDEF)-like protein